MAKKKQEKTVKPSGLTLTRNGASFVASWKIGDKDYGEGQTFQYKVNNGSWAGLALSNPKKDTKKTFTLNLASYWPHTSTKLTSVSFRVCGRRKNYTTGSGSKKKTHNPITSNWTSCTMAIAVPAAPTISAALSSDHTNVCTFSGSAANDAAGGKIFRSIWYQTQLVRESNVTDGSKLPANGWTGGTAGASYSLTYTEDTTLLAQASYTRWVRVRTRGSAGDSGWVYSKHVYARPYQTKNVSAKVTKTSTGYTCTVNWTADSTASHPIKSTVVQYTFVTPGSGLSCPIGASWTDANVSADTSLTDAASFGIDQQVGEDQCLFVRVNTTWDSNVTYGSPVLAAAGPLDDPTSLSVSSDQQTFRATITATNNSSVPDSFLIVGYKPASSPQGYIVGIIPHNQSSVTVQCPSWAQETAVRFAVQAVQGTYKQVTRADGTSSYTITKVNMKSGILESGGVIPQAPTGVTLMQTEVQGTIRVTFNWSWQAATSAEVSWADHDDAWESTDEPNTYLIANTHAAAWNISGLETGKTWYVRVRLAQGTGDDQTFGAYCETVSIDLSSAPAIPVLTLSDGVITDNGSVTATWAFASTDGTAQAHAELAELVDDGSDIAYRVVANTLTAQFATVYAQDLEWESGETHTLVVRVISGSGRASEWSDPASVAIAEPLEATIAQISLVEETIITEETERVVDCLTEMPFTITVTGAGTGGSTSVIIERAAAYHSARPDESEFNGYEGETITMFSQTGEAQISIGIDDLLGNLDDGAAYRVIATIQDGLGQSAEVSRDFEVHWTHQAIIPEATAEVLTDDMAVKLTPIAPTGTETGDVCDIYRLSVDKPVLIYPDASWGTVYVDPYPAIGEYGGHRFVFKTINGDYITADDEFAWTDLREDEGDLFETDYNVIDFGRDRVMLQYNIDIQNSWKKDFKETKYLGGSIQGDWNPAVTRKSSINAVTVVAEDQETIEAMRRLATYAGICHVRTKDGSSYAADVQVTENYAVDKAHKLASFTLSVTRVDTEDYDGMTFAEWQETHEEEE